MRKRFLALIALVAVVGVLAFSTSGCREAIDPEEALPHYKMN